MRIPARRLASKALPRTSRKYRRRPHALFLSREIEDLGGMDPAIKTHHRWAEAVGYLSAKVNIYMAGPLCYII